MTSPNSCRPTIFISTGTAGFGRLHQRLHERRVPIDFLTVSEELDQMGQLAEIGGSAYLTSLINNVPTSLHAESYGHIVEDTAIRRRMLNAANDIAKLAYQEDIGGRHSNG